MMPTNGGRRELKTAVHIRDWAYSLGVRLRVSDGDVLYAPRRTAPADLVAELHQYKADIVSLLTPIPEPTREPIPADFKHPAKTQLITELVKGQGWLARRHEVWCLAVEGQNLDSMPADDETFSMVMADWFHKETVLRNLFDYSHCVHGEGQHCPVDAPARCQGC